MLTDSPEERIEHLEKRLKSIEQRGIDTITEQRLRSSILDMEIKLGLKIDDVSDRLFEHVNQPSTTEIDNPLYLEDYIGVINSDLGEASKLLNFLYENWHRVRVKK